jgi:hypothetical protein
VDRELDVDAAPLGIGVRGDLDVFGAERGAQLVTRSHDLPAREPIPGGDAEWHVHRRARRDRTEPIQRTSTIGTVTSSLRPRRTARGTPTWMSA